jgi:hypothetical protein
LLQLLELERHLELEVLVLVDGLRQSLLLPQAVQQQLFRLPSTGLECTFLQPDRVVGLIILIRLLPDVRVGLQVVLPDECGPVVLGLACLVPVQLKQVVELVLSVELRQINELLVFDELLQPCLQLALSTRRRIELAAGLEQHGVVDGLLLVNVPPQVESYGAAAWTGEEEQT